MAGLPLAALAAALAAAAAAAVLSLILFTSVVLYTMERASTTGTANAQ